MAPSSTGSEAGGLIRIGAVLAAFRGDFREHKTRHREARHQPIKLDHPDHLFFGHCSLRQAEPWAQKLGPFSDQKMRTGFKELCKALELPRELSTRRAHCEQELPTGHGSMLKYEDSELVRRRSAQQGRAGHVLSWT